MFPCSVHSLCLARFRLLWPGRSQDSFRQAALFYRFEWDHVWLGGDTPLNPRGHAEDRSSYRIPSAADYGQFDKNELLEMVERMR